MYENEPTFDDLAEIAAAEDAALIAAHSPTFWDTDAAELAYGHDPADPWTHPSWEVTEALAGGWEDPAAAIEVLDQTVIEDSRLTGLADTPYGRPTVRHVDEPLTEEAFVDLVLALVPVAVDGSWPAETAPAAA